MIKILKTIQLIYWVIAYRIKWIDRLRIDKPEFNDDESKTDCSGYYRVKRIWVWILFFPVVFMYRTVLFMFSFLFEYFLSLTYYYYNWISSKRRPLSIKDKIKYLKYLSK